MNERVTAHFNDSIAVQQASLALVPQIVAAGALLARALAAGNKILACGNGGSAADAQHFSAELLGRFERERRGLPAVALSCDTSTLTAVANDYSFDDVFARQVLALGRAGDVLVGLSTSGNSENVLRAVAAAQSVGMPVIALGGRDGGRIGAALAARDIELRVPAERTCRIQEVHGLIIHCLCDLVDTD